MFKLVLNHDHPDVQAGFRERRGTGDQIVNIRWTIEKARELQKNIYICFIHYAKAFVWITTNYGKLLKKWEYQTTLSVSWETCMQVMNQQLELDLDELLVQNWERSMTMLYIVTLLI